MAGWLGGSSAAPEAPKRPPPRHLLAQKEMMYQTLKMGLKIASEVFGQHLCNRISTVHIPPAPGIRKRRRRTRSMQAATNVGLSGPSVGRFGGCEEHQGIV